MRIYMKLNSARQIIQPSLNLLNQIFKYLEYSYYRVIEVAWKR